MSILKENPTDTAMIKALATPLEVIGVNDIPEINKVFLPLLNKLLTSKEYKLINNIPEEISNSLRKLSVIGVNCPKFCRKIKLYTFIYILENPNFSVPMLVVANNVHNNVVTTHVILRDKFGNKVIKTLGVNKNYSKKLIDEVISSLRRTLK